MLANGVSVALNGLEELHLDGRTLKTISEHTQLLHELKLTGRA